MIQHCAHGRDFNCAFGDECDAFPKSKAVMGIDPGVRGGAAVLGRDGHVVWVVAFSSKDTYQSMDNTMAFGIEYLKLHGSDCAFLEKVHSLPHDGHVGAFTFGRVVGILAEAVIARGVRLREVPPMIWQSKLNCLSGGDKNVTKKKAREVFPGMKITHATADALLIARYGWLSLCEKP